jgi:hypothetical protein
MDYHKIYSLIINRARNRNLKGYKERHHIIPKCLGGTNKKDNIVNLTAREHFFCHQLLCEIYPENKKLVFALWSMANQKAPLQKRTFKVSSKLYERLKIKAAKLISIRCKGTKLSDETKKKMVISRTGQKKGPYNPKEQKFTHTCNGCGVSFKTADVKGKWCSSCKEPRQCKCGCGKIVKTPGRLYYTGCQLRGKTYKEIYNFKSPKSGFKAGNKFGK